MYAGKVSICAEVEVRNLRGRFSAIIRIREVIEHFRQNLPPAGLKRLTADAAMLPLRTFFHTGNGACAFRTARGDAAVDWTRLWAEKLLILVTCCQKLLLEEHVLPMETMLKKLRLDCI